METNPAPIESLLQRAELYNKASIELLKLKSVDKIADLASATFSRTLLTIVLGFFTLTLTIAISFWLGDLLGKTYYGFLIVASVYGVIAFILFLCHPIVKTKMANSIITQMLN